MLITRSQGAACRRAAEKIARGEWSGVFITDLGMESASALVELGWERLVGAGSFKKNRDSYDQSQVLMALLWCAEIAGEE